MTDLSRCRTLQGYARDLYRAARILYWHSNGNKLWECCVSNLQCIAAGCSRSERQLRGAVPDPRQDLLDLMGQVSEEQYCAGWNDGLESALYRIAFCGADPEYGGGPIDAEKIARLRELAEACGGWWSWSSAYEAGDTGMKFIGLSEAARRWSNKWPA